MMREDTVSQSSICDLGGFVALNDDSPDGRMVPSLNGPEFDRMPQVYVLLAYRVMPKGLPDAEAQPDGPIHGRSHKARSKIGLV
jgi:hypothetical protein